MKPGSRLLDWASLRRQLLKGESPYVGVPRLDAPPLAFKRSFLASTVGDLAYAFAWIEPGASYTLLDKDGKRTREAQGDCLRVVSACGTRRYRYWDQNTVARSGFLGIRREQLAWTGRKRAALARANGWVRRERWHDDGNGDGEVRVSWYKQGLVIRDRTVWHKASGKSVAIAHSQTDAFVLAERALALWDQWQEADPAKLLESMGGETRKALSALRRAA